MVSSRGGAVEGLLQSKMSHALHWHQSERGVWDGFLGKVLTVSVSVVPSACVSYAFKTPDRFFHMVATVELARPNARLTSDLLFPASISRMMCNFCSSVNARRLRPWIILTDGATLVTHSETRLWKPQDMDGYSKSKGLKREEGTRSRKYTGQPLPFSNPLHSLTFWYWIPNENSKWKGFSTRLRQNCRFYSRVNDKICKINIKFEWIIKLLK